MRREPNLDLYNDLCVAIEQALWDAGVMYEDRTIAYTDTDGTPYWREPEPVIAAIASRCTGVFAVHGVNPARTRRVGKNGSRHE